MSKYILFLYSFLSKVGCVVCGISDWRDINQKMFYDIKTNTYNYVPLMSEVVIGFQFFVNFIHSLFCFRFLHIPKISDSPFINCLFTLIFGLLVIIPCYVVMFIIRYPIDLILFLIYMILLLLRLLVFIFTCCFMKKHEMTPIVYCNR